MATRYTLASYPNGALTGNKTYYQALDGGFLYNVGVEAIYQTRIRDTCTLSHLYVNVTANTVSATSTIRTRKNGANGGQSVSIGSDATGLFEDTSNTDSLADGDLACYQVVAGADGGGSITLAFISTLLAPSSTAGINSSAFGSSYAASTTYYRPISGVAGTTLTTESMVRYTNHLATVLSHLRAYVTTNSCTSTTTVYVRKNGADGAQNLSIGASATGAFEDTSNTDTIGDGDETNYRIATGATGSIYMYTVQTKSSVGMISAGNSSAAVVGSEYRGLGLGQSATQSYVQLKARGLVPDVPRFKYLGAAVSSNNRTVSVTLAFRKNGTNAISVSVPSSTTGYYEETSTQVDATDNADTFNFASIASGGTGQLGVRMWAITEVPGYTAVSQTFAALTEAIQQTAKTNAVSIEAVQNLVLPFVTLIEADAPDYITQTFLVPIEARQGLTATRLLPLETIPLPTTGLAPLRLLELRAFHGDTPDTGYDILGSGLTLISNDNAAVRSNLLDGIRVPEPGEPAVYSAVKNLRLLRAYEEGTLLTNFKMWFSPRNLSWNGVDVFVTTGASYVAPTQDPLPGFVNNASQYTAENPLVLNASALTFEQTFGDWIQVQLRVTSRARAGLPRTFYVYLSWTEWRPN